MADENNNSIFTTEENAILELTKKARVDTLTLMIKDGVPVKSGDIRVMTELATSLDKVVTDSAAIRIKHSDVQNKEAMVGIVAATLVAVSRNKRPAADRQVALPEHIDVSVIVPGHMDISPTQLDPNDFSADHEDE